MKTIVVCLLVACLGCTGFAQSVKDRAFQFSFISPIGTNGMNSHETVNMVSVNLLGGYSYGNKVVEIGGIYNVNIGFTKGLQIAGMVNYSHKGVNPVQLAGLANIVKKGDVPFQLAGIFNYSECCNGFQMAGVVNVAKRVKGVQLGLVNIADESDGVSVGLINVVRNGGKYEFEVSASEALNTALSFKLGTNRLYTIFSGGVQYWIMPVEYALGIGFGTHLDWKYGWANQIELLGYSYSSNQSFKSDELNCLLQLRLPVSKQIRPHFKIFAGPVVNMTLADNGKNRDSLFPWTMWHNDGRSTELKGWIGFCAGVRF